MFFSKEDREERKFIRNRIIHCQEKIRILEGKANTQQIKIDRLEQQVKILSCDHKEIEIDTDECGFSRKICKGCGKLLKTYITQKELLEDMLEFHKEKAAEAEEKLKEYESNESN
jgi:uncharacterized protein (UPF0335 family)